MKKRLLALLTCSFLICMFVPAVAFAAQATIDANGGAFEGGSTTQTVELDENGCIGNWPSGATRDGYSQIGWSEFKDDAAGNEDIWEASFVDGATIYAIWHPIKVAMTFDELVEYYCADGVPLNVTVIIGADMTITGTVDNQATLIVPQGVTVTIANGGTLVGGVNNSGKIIVQSGGSLQTTMGGSIVNHGEIVVEEGAQVRSQMGASLVNCSDGLLTLNGVFDCGSFGGGAWFSNEGEISGSGNVIVYDAAAGHPEAVSNLDETVASVQQMVDNTQVTVVSNDDWDDTVPMYRLYNPNSGEHFYTGNAEERDSLVVLGWKDEGVGWYAPATDKSTPVYRLYNAHGGEHHYTMSAEERAGLVEAGWTYEDVGWYSDSDKTVPLLREYNPNKFSCNHNYTTSQEEHDFLVSIGWKDEGYAWYAVAPGGNDAK